MDYGIRVENLLLQHGVYDGSSTGSRHEERFSNETGSIGMVYWEQGEHSERTVSEDDLSKRLEHFYDTFEGPPDWSFLPEGYGDPVGYFTDTDGDWADLRYARMLFKTYGPSGPAWVALRELEELERAFSTLERRYLRLWELTLATRTDREDGTEHGDWEEAERMATRIATGEYPDQGVFDSIRAQLVTLGEDAGPPSEPGP
jgi:hypothetical protein